jgi:uncharacterized protein (TIGR02646 family)
MIRIRSRRLDADTRKGLDGYQAHVNSGQTYEARVERAKAHFEAKNTSKDRVFKVVRKLLEAMSPGPVRCMYCEDSFANQVEHFRPKDLYPEVAFAWSNFLYSCSSCNVSKSNTFAVLAGGVTPKLIDVTRKRGAPVVPPSKGKPALINPLKEDPLQFFELDLANSFIFTPTAPQGSVEFDRAVYTRDLMGLNKDVYCIARRSAFKSYAGVLRDYLHDREAGTPKKDLVGYPRFIRESNHQTVWAEMKRQHASIPFIRSRFLEAPEALKW